jgi:hypothetical protein
MYKIQIRFNTEHGATDLYWRVTIQGEEHVFNKVIIKKCDVQTCMFDLDGKLKGCIEVAAFDFVVDNHYKTLTIS